MYCQSQTISNTSLPDQWHTISLFHTQTEKEALVLTKLRDAAFSVIVLSKKIMPLLWELLDAWAHVTLLSAIFIKFYLQYLIILYTIAW